jgi:hypothetical protein
MAVLQLAQNFKCESGKIWFTIRFHRAQLVGKFADTQGLPEALSLRCAKKPGRNTAAVRHI